MDQGKRLFERSEFEIDPTLTECRSVPKGKRRDSDCGSPFFWLLFFGEAKKSDEPPGDSRQSTQPSLQSALLTIKNSQNPIDTGANSY